MIQNQVAEGAIVNTDWLKKKGLTNHAVDNLVKSKQLKTMRRGIYLRERTMPVWEDMVYFLQQVIMLDLTVGGLTALELQHLNHYLSVSDKRVIHLYERDSMPAWVNNIVEDVHFVKHAEHAERNERASMDTGDLMVFTKMKEWRNTKGIRICVPERAILQVLNDVPGKISFEHADELMQGLTSLSPRVLQKLLEVYNNIKVRRLFFGLRTVIIINGWRGLTGI